MCLNTKRTVSHWSTVLAPVRLSELLEFVFFGISRLLHESLQLSLAPHNLLLLDLNLPRNVAVNMSKWRISERLAVNSSNLLCSFNDSNLHLFFFNSLLRFGRLKI